MDYLTLHDDQGNTVVVHTAQRRRGKIWTASWSAASPDGLTLDRRTTDYFCSVHYLDYGSTQDTVDVTPPKALQQLVSDALWLAWIRSRRDQYEARRRTKGIRRGPVYVDALEGVRP